VHRSGPIGGVARDLKTATTYVEDVNGGLPLTVSRGIGISLQHDRGYGYGLVKGHVPSGPPILSCQR
jgi:hypothetical protein